MTILRVSLPIVAGAKATGRRAIALALLGAALTVLGGCYGNDAANIDTAAGEIGWQPGSELDRAVQLLRADEC